MLFLKGESCQILHRVQLGMLSTTLELQLSTHLNKILIFFLNLGENETNSESQDDLLRITVYL